MISKRKVAFAVLTATMAVSTNALSESDYQLRDSTSTILYKNENGNRVGFDGSPNAGTNIMAGSETALSIRAIRDQLNNRITSTEQTINNRVDNVETSMGNQFAAVNNSLGTLNGRVSANTGDIATNREGVTANAAGVFANATDINGVKNRLSDAENKVTSNTQSIASLGGDVSTLTAASQNLQSSLSSAQSTADRAWQYVGSLTSTAGSGGGCSTEGSLSRTSTGDILVCQSGVWRSSTSQGDSLTLLNTWEGYGRTFSSEAQAVGATRNRLGDSCDSLPVYRLAKYGSNTVKFVIAIVEGDCYSMQ